jgi:hypothetical protein
MMIAADFRPASLRDSFSEATRAVAFSEKCLIFNQLFKDFRK